MLFLYRPRETWMPFSLPRNRTDQAAYNRSLQRQFESTRRVPPPTPTRAPLEPRAEDPDRRLDELRSLRESGALTDAEFESVAARLGRR